MIAVSMILPLMLAVFLVGPRWNEKRTRKFIKWMNTMEKVELAQDKGSKRADD